MSKQIRIEKKFGSLTITPEPGPNSDHIVIVSECEGETGHVMWISRDEAHMLHTDLGEMLGSFVLSEGE